MKNARIMVNFTEKKVVHTESHAGTKEYQDLMKNGYINVGIFKPITGQFFWKDEFFDPAAKYPKGDDYWTQKAAELKHKIFEQ